MVGGVMMLAARRSARRPGRSLRGEIGYIFRVEVLLLLLPKTLLLRRLSILRVLFR